MIGSVKTTTGALADPKASQTDKLKAVARQFEAVFLRQMIGSMRQAKLSDDIMGSDATDQFREMQDSHVADDLASKGALGIADMLVKQFAARVVPAADSAAADAKAVSTAATAAATATIAGAAAKGAVR
jgi:flagellar protein FlgJ